MIKEKDEVVCLRYVDGCLRRAMDLGEFKRAHVDDEAHLFSLLGEFAVRRCPLVNLEKLQADLLRQASEFPPFIGHGVLVPHVYSDQVQDSVCFVLSLGCELTLQKTADSVSWSSFSQSHRRFREPFSTFV